MKIEIDVEGVNKHERAIEKAITALEEIKTVLQSDNLPPHVGDMRLICRENGILDYYKN